MLDITPPKKKRGQVHHVHDTWPQRAQQPRKATPAALLEDPPSKPDAINLMAALPTDFECAREEERA